jgi:hypothetical protein
MTETKMSNWSDGGSDWGGDFSQVRRNPRRKAYGYSNEETKRVQESLSLPERQPDVIDHVHGDIIARAEEMLTTLRERKRNDRLHREAVIQAKAMAPYLNPDEYGVTEGERAELDAELDPEDEHEDEGWSTWPS